MHMCGMTHACVWHESFICVESLVHMLCDRTVPLSMYSWYSCVACIRGTPHHVFVVLHSRCCMSCVPCDVFVVFHMLYSWQCIRGIPRHVLVVSHVMCWWQCIRGSFVCDVREDG